MFCWKETNSTEIRKWDWMTFQMQWLYYFWQRRLAQLLYLSISQFCTWSRGLVLNPKIPPSGLLRDRYDDLIAILEAYNVRRFGKVIQYRIPFIWIHTGKETSQYELYRRNVRWKIHKFGNPESIQIIFSHTHMGLSFSLFFEARSSVKFINLNPHIHSFSLHISAGVDCIFRDSNIIRHHLVSCFRWMTTNFKI